MKKYIKTLGTWVFAVAELTRGDLVRAKEGRYDLVINTEDGTYYDVDKNEWVKIPQESD